MTGGAIGGRRLIAHFPEGFTPMTLEASFHVELFTPVPIFGYIAVTAGATYACGRMDSMMKDNMFRQRRFLRPWLFGSLGQGRIQHFNPRIFR